jgi:hypothetical protein
MGQLGFFDADLEAELFNLRRDIERNWIEADWPYFE